ncbi:hypothetical protein [Pontiella sulfatireligans]|uniref:Uncharacterized protein n=1 Tax=Pontiella sulfatireligans TaxID=2750658 RepID=A0A6C2UQQ7_9BACT|nr:hypothetical protein [Pontiella sulfatireligans]VGO22548.1 hypothetical protein SCARR_04632 [Pontiella sulfatireligans]
MCLNDALLIEEKEGDDPCKMHRFRTGACPASSEIRVVDTHEQMVFGDFIPLVPLLETLLVKRCAPDEF